VNIDRVEEIENASAAKRGLIVWYAAFGGIFFWMAHLVFVASAEHWTYLHSRYVWTLHAATVICALATILALALSWRLYRAAAGSDAAARDDAGQMLFLAQFGLLVGVINLALILVEGSYVLFIPRG
jgi:hypothetical protein